LTMIYIDGSMKTYPSLEWFRVDMETNEEQIYPCVDQEITDHRIKLISREIHDEVGGSIASVLNMLELLEHYWQERDMTRATVKMSDARRTLHHALRHAKELALSLRMPMRLEPIADIKRAGREGLVLAPLPQARASGARHIECEDVFPILREAVRNAVSHSAAEHITVQLSTSGGDLTMSVEDDGTGLRPSASESPTSLGLRSMRERAALLGGAFRLTRGSSGGTRVHVTVPLEQAQR
jgi:signal transduction histidine kinase